MKAATTLPKMISDSSSTNGIEIDSACARSSDTVSFTSL